MRHPRGTAALAMVFSSVTLATCVFPTERDDSVHVTVDPLPVLIRGSDTYATARAWQILAAGDSQQIANVSFVWSSGDPLTATVDANGRSEEHTSELQSLAYLVCRLLLEKKKMSR